MAAIPKSLGVLPPFVLQYDPSNAPVVQVVVSGGGLTRPAAVRLRVQQHRAGARGHPRRRLGRRSTAGACGRSTSSSIRSSARSAPPDRRGRRARGARSRTRCCRRASSSPEQFDANVYTNAVPTEVAAIGDGVIKKQRRSAGAHPRRGARRGRRRARHAVGARQRQGRRLPQRAAHPRRQHARDRRSASRRPSTDLKDLPPGVEVKAIFDQSTFVRTAYFGLKKEIVQALVLIAIVILIFLQSTRGTLIVAVAIPLSFAITLIILYSQGQTLNAFTLGGLTLAMGRLVDDAVVVLESIHRHQKKGMIDRAGGAARHQRGGAAGARLDADDDGRAAAGHAAQRPGQEAVRAAGAHRRRRHDRVVLRRRSA